MAGEVFDKYDKPAFVGTFADAGVASDPDTVKFGIKDPAGNTTVYEYGVDDELTKTGTGIYTISILLNQSGTWYWRWQVTGTPTGADEGTFNVNRANVDID